MVAFARKLRTATGVIALVGAAHFPAGSGTAAPRVADAGSVPALTGAAASQGYRLDQPPLASLQSSAPASQPEPVAEIAQAATSLEKIVRDIEERGFTKVTGLMRRGENYVFQAVDPYGQRVRVVMNAQSGEIVGLSRIAPKKN